MFNIYFVLERDKLTVNPDTVKVSDNRISGICEQHTQNGVIKHRFDTHTLFETGDSSTVSCPYPHNYMKILNAGEILSEGPVSLVVPMADTQLRHLAEYEVLYVGQATRNGEAMARLRSHEKVLQIYRDVLKFRPHREVWLFLMDFEASLLHSMNPTSVHSRETFESSIAQISAAQQLCVTDRQLLTNACEAALIRYFEPLYNSDFVDSFPSVTHRSYRALFDLDINAIGAVVSTHSLGVKFFSSKATLNALHSAIFALRKGEDSKFMLEPFVSAH